MKVSDLKYKPFELECCTNDCTNKDIIKCVQPLCIDLAIHNDLVQSNQNKAPNRAYLDQPLVAPKSAEADFR